MHADESPNKAETAPQAHFNQNHVYGFIDPLTSQRHRKACIDFQTQHQIQTCMIIGHTYIFKNDS